jgi:GNAT superfamily N-acetyltransferase
VTQAAYDIVHYRPEFRRQAVDVLQYLWGNHPERNQSYFKWKYEDNPYTNSPLGIVALCGDQVVGFRGYFAAGFSVPGRDDGITVLLPDDTCVHPDHRRRGLSVLMGNKAMKEYAQEYRIFFNTSCTKDSLPGYRRMGFLPLTERAHLSRSSLLGFIRYAPRARRDRPFEASRVRFGRFGDVLVSDRPRPQEMASLAAQQGREDGKLRLIQDENFFRWRLCNPRYKYVFCYLMDGDDAIGYVVLGMSRCRRRGYVVDYASGDNQAIKEILAFTIKARTFDVLSIFSYCVDDGMWRILRDLGFRRNSLVRMAETALRGQMPLLIRPVKETYTEQDFFIAGLDMRRIENWSLKPLFDSSL